MIIPLYVEISQWESRRTIEEAKSELKYFNPMKEIMVLRKRIKILGIHYIQQKVGCIRIGQETCTRYPVWIWFREALEYIVIIISTIGLKEAAKPSLKLKVYNHLFFVGFLTTNLTTMATYFVSRHVFARVGIFRGTKKEPSSSRMILEKTPNNTFRIHPSCEHPVRSTDDATSSMCSETMVPVCVYSLQTLRPFTSPSYRIERCPTAEKLVHGHDLLFGEAQGLLLLYYYHHVFRRSNIFPPLIGSIGLCQGLRHLRNPSPSASKTRLSHSDYDCDDKWVANLACFIWYIYNVTTL